jgi:hypothetical protein
MSLVFLAGLCGQSVLASTNFDPILTLGATYSDNIFLDSEMGTSEIVYHLLPTFALDHESRRLAATVDYRYEGYKYSDLDEYQSYHRYNAVLTTTLVQDNLFLEFGGNRSQSLREPEGQVPGGNLPLAGNRVDRVEYWVSPYFDLEIGSKATLHSSYRNSWVEYDDDDGIEKESRTGIVTFDNYRGGRGFTWALRYEKRQAIYDGSRVWDYQRAAAEIGTWIGTGLRIFGAGGKESAWDMPLDSSMEDAFWEAGLAKEVGERMRLEIAAGERGFGTSYRASWLLKFKRGTTELSYDETPSIEGINRYQPRGLRFPDDPEDFLTGIDSYTSYVNERLQWNLNIDRTRSTFSLVVFDERRTNRLKDDGTRLEDESQTGLNLSLSWDVGVRSKLTSRVELIEREFESGFNDRIGRAEIGINYALGALTTIALNYRYVEQNEKSSNDLVQSPDYDANSITLSLSRRFSRPK